MISKADNTDLKKALEAHLGETEGQVERIEKVFKLVDVPARGKKCEAIEGIIDEAKEHMSEIEDERVLDAGIISSAQAVEHYEISRYGTLIAWAKELDHNNVVGLLTANLRQEKAADKKLNGLAEGGVNRRATGRTVSRAPARRAAASSATVKRKTGSAKRRTAKKKHPRR